jgi:hypothetical protein
VDCRDGAVVSLSADASLRIELSWEGKKAELGVTIDVCFSNV